MERKKLKQAIQSNNRWHKNCRSLRKRNGKICKVCPFRDLIEQMETDKIYVKN